MKKKPYNIDYIVNDQSTPKVQKTEQSPVQGNQTRVVQHSTENQKVEDEQSNRSPRGTKVRPKEGGVCSYQDICAEVKHPRTPLNTVNQETHSPQLPMPSPNYPVQTETQVPNTLVPTVNNNYITTPQATSQKENATPSCQTHSNRLNNKSDLKQQTDHSNLEISKRSVNKVNSPPNAKKEERTTETCFTVLNIPNLSFQTPSPSKRPRLSKIDLATLKRKMRRKKRLDAEGRTVKSKTEADTSDSSCCLSSESESEQPSTELWIKSGPPSKLDLNPEKVDFLKRFGLTTHMEKNCKFVFCIISSSTIR